MKLSELVSHQADWESERGINNGRYNLDRIQMELDEAKEADSPEDAMEELVDVFIITAGGLAKACEELGLEFTVVDDLLAKKLNTNSRKYDLSFFSGADPIEAQMRARHFWKYGSGFEPNDYY